MSSCTGLCPQKKTRLRRIHRCTAEVVNPSTIRSVVYCMFITKLKDHRERETRSCFSLSWGHARRLGQSSKIVETEVSSHLDNQPFQQQQKKIRKLNSYWLSPDFILRLDQNQGKYCILVSKSGEILYSDVSPI